MVADSLHGSHFFLAIFQTLKNTFALVRLSSNMTFFEQPPARVKGKKGAPTKQGRIFKLSNPSRLPDKFTSFLLGDQTVSLKAWKGLHFKKLPGLAGVVMWI